MAKKKIESTHKHRNLIDDLLDAALAIVGFLYVMFAEQVGLKLTDVQVAMGATAGATVRVALRKVLMRLWGEKLGIEEDAEDAQSSPVASSDAGSED